MDPSKTEYDSDISQVRSTDGAPLSRAMTVSLSPEQYERLFFQPSAPKGDLAKRLGNPTLLGLLGFLIPYTSTMLILLGWGGADAPISLIGLTGDYYFLGAIAMNLAGVAEFVLGNPFPMAVFIVYGCHWGALAYAQDPGHALIAAFSAVGGADGTAWASSQAFHNVTMALVSFVFFVGSMRVNVFFVFTFFGLVGLFSSLAAANFAIETATTAADVAHIGHLLNVGGGFGFIGLICGWYLAIITACASTGIPCPLPVLDLSTRVFPAKKDRSSNV